MIREILIPSQIGSYFLFTQTILSFDISDTTIKAILVSVKGKNLSIEKWFEAKATTDEERTEEIRKIKEQLTHTPNQIIATLSADQITFKQIQLPFNNLSKIRQVLPFELSDSLPFPLEDAVFDAIPLTHNNDEASRSWLTTSMQSDSMHRQLLPLLEEGFIPARVTTGPIELFAILLYMNQLMEEKTYIAIDSNHRSTEILLIHNQELLGVRTLENGTNNIQTDELLKNSTTEKLHKEISFSINALLRTNRLIGHQYTVILSGSATDDEELAMFLSKEEITSIQKINPLDLIKLPEIEQQDKHRIPSTFFKCLSATVPWSMSAPFNLGRIFQEESREKKFLYRTILSLTLIAFLITTPIILSMVSIRRLRKESTRSKAEITTKLKKEFNLTGRQRSLKDTLNQSEQALIKNEQLWSALTTNKYAFLRYIQKLNTSLSREKAKLDLRRLAIKRDEFSGQEIMILDGSVENFGALREFEDGLRASQLFTTIPRLQELKFSIQLPINKESKGGM